MSPHFSKPAATGFTIIEMLVALLILSIGLLGVAALQTTGQRFNHAAYLRTQATFLAYDIMDRIRANSAATSSTSQGYKLAEGDTPTFVDCDANSCTTDNLANYDKWTWDKLVKNNLPADTTREITWVSSTTFTGYRIELSWVEQSTVTQIWKVMP